MNSKLRIALAQINTYVGDLEGNMERILGKISEAGRLGCDLIAFPELCIPGYPPEDLLLRRQFVKDQEEIVNELVGEVEDLVCVVGYAHREATPLHNAAAVLQHRQRKGIYFKTHLPNYSVFDEERYFEAGRMPLVVVLNGVKVGISICEDIWIRDSVVEAEAFVGGAEVLLNISASPYHMEKTEERRELMAERARRTRSVVAYCNLVGGQDELVFDGSSLIVGPDGDLLATGKAFEEDLLILDVDVARVRELRKTAAFRASREAFHNPFPEIRTVALDDIEDKCKPEIPSLGPQPLPEKEDEIYHALILGLSDYVHKNGFSHVTLGLSGGIDSALVATLAADALGSENVIAVSMPSRYSSQGSLDDAQTLAQNLGIRLLTLPIENIFQAYLDLLAEPFQGREPDITEENLQARIRGNLLMALSNKFGWLVLATGNKSEVSVGYATIYGDMAGGFAPLKDVTKLMVYRLCEYRNKKAGYDLIPQSIIRKPPSAELRPDQKDQDSLPPYEVLDPILELYVENEMSVKEIAQRGFDEEIVREVARLVDLNEYKRRQAAPGIKITPRAFGKDRRMPITNFYRAR